MKKGIVKEYSNDKGFGFITGEDGEDYFVHVSGLREYLKSKGLRAGQNVSFDVDFGMKGDKAVNVRLG
ncbi:MAG: cold-shock protein [Candidatus Marinimicrobia bacterium]|nr:cold-shock protein [Candidatus Neomarinimicrobiota bacterium]|tara:strand:+ start:366 stop:569 length:204 start_codon:yes stop_codon:yes gene_type:complete